MVRRHSGALPGIPVSLRAVSRLLVSLCISLTLLLMGGLALADREGAPDGGGSLGAPVQDPHEAINRRIFAFNAGLVDYLVEPTAAWLGAHLNDQVQRVGHNMYENLVEPEFILSNLLVGDRDAALVSGKRFLVNSTLGLLGAWDAAGWLGHERQETGFVGSLCTAGLSPGNYVVLPAVGPASGHATLLIGGFFALEWYALAYLSSTLATADLVVDFSASAASLRDIRNLPEAGLADPYQIQRDQYLRYLHTACTTSTALAGPD